jgi:monoamine oxidase
MCTDVAVVGGGIGGCYVGSRLLSSGPAPGRVALFEASERIGGRLMSVRMPGPVGVWADLGAMRFDADERLVCRVIARLGLTAHVRPFHFGLPENLAYIRGEAIRLDALAGAPYALTRAERGLGPDGLARLAVERARRRLDPQALRSATWAAVLARVLSRDARRLLHDAGGYSAAIRGQSAEAAMAELDRQSGGGYLRLDTGFEALAERLHDAFVAAGGRVHRRHRLEQVSRVRLADGSRGFALRFTRHGDRTRELCVHARSVVLALPQGALARLRGWVAALPAIREGLAAVVSVPAAKLFLGYDSPWWRRAGVVRGRSTTDLALRQLWYWSSQHEPPAVLLAAYPSGPSVAAWRRIAAGAPFPDAGSQAPPVTCRASTDVVHHAHALLERVHGLPHSPSPTAARWQDWSLAPHHGGWHVWAAGHDRARVAARMARPSGPDGLFVVSDCWTERPGSVEGTLASAERVLDMLARGEAGRARAGD